MLMYNSTETIAQLKSSPEAALQTYSNLRNFATALYPLQAEADGAAPHLLDLVEHTASNLRTTIKDAFAQELNAILGKILWPKPQVAMPAGLEMEWDTVVGRLLDLQKPELETRVPTETQMNKSDQPLVLLPLQIMVEPLESRFRFHFYGDKPTNRLDKPEYFLAHVLDFVRAHEAFVNDYVQPLLLEHFGKSDILSDLAYIDATSALITALLPMLRTKVFALVSQVSAQPQLLSHLIHELMGFDTTLRDEWKYAGSTATASPIWKGLTGEVLVQQDWFGRWLQVEKDFALSRYQNIIDDPDSSTLDYDSLSSNATKPTKAAIRVNDLLETITDRYRPLSSFKQKLRFLVEIQISIFDRFHTRLSSGLEAYLTMTSRVGRTMQGIAASDLASIQGVGALDRLCRIFGSAEYLEKALRDWSDDVFFLDLWTELQSRAQNNSGIQSRPSSAAGPRESRSTAAALNIADIASRTSKTLIDSHLDEMDDTNGALFDETANAYARLRARSESVIVETLTTRIREVMRPYTKSSIWTTLTTTEDLPSEPSLELQPVLSLLDESLTFLAGALAPLPMRQIGRSLVKVVDAYVFDRLLMMHTFAKHGARQLELDVESIVKLFERKVGGAVGRNGMRRCLEGVRLLRLKVKASGGAGREGVAEGVEDDAWDGEAEDADHLADDGGMPGDELGLWEVEKRMFASNESAREVLEDLGMFVLSQTEGRQVLQRRVELAR